MALQYSFSKLATIYLISALIQSANSFILIPEEFTTLSNAIWSFLPPIKSGVSSKVGFGFRLGRNADFQVLFEIGPQMNNTSNGSNAKVDTSDSQNEVIPLANIRKKRTKYPKKVNKISS